MKRGLLLLTFSLLVSLSFIVFVSGQSCFVTDRNICQSLGGDIVLGLSSVSNAHGETASSGNYNTVLCCDLSESLTCSGNNSFLGLSSSTNAHAEAPEQNNYAIRACYADLSCISTQNFCGGPNAYGYPIKMVSLSSATNAHLGIIGGSSPNLNICCTSSTYINIVDSNGNGIADSAENGVIDSGESCDHGLADPFNGITCSSYGFTGGNLICNSFGQIDTVQCTGGSGFGICGNNVINIGETCDGNNLGGLGCIDYGLPEGSLSCGISCRVNTNQCSPAEKGFWSSNGETTISSLDTIPGATTVKLVLKNTKLPQGTSVAFDIYENDLFLDDFIRTVNAVVNANGTAVAQWTITLDDLSKTNDYEEFYFNVNNKQSNYLSLNILGVSACNNIVICKDYQGQSLCEADSCGIALNAAPSNLDCSDPFIDCFCGWSSQCGFNFAVTNPDTNLTTGTCIFAESTGDDCADGFLSYSWTVSWTGSPEDQPLSCIEGSKVIECPAQVQLPFFGVYNILLTVIAIVLIYYFLVVRKEGNKGKKRKRK